MLMQIVLHEDQLNGLRTIREFGVSGIEVLVEAISNAPKPLFQPSDLLSLLRDQFIDHPVEIEGIVKQLLSFYNLMRQQSISVDDLLQSLEQGIKNADATAKWSAQEIAEWAALCPQLRKLFTIPSLRIMVKAIDLSYDHSNLFQSARILTDIRPVFDDEASSIVGAIVSYSLRLSYSSSEGSKNVTIALDDNDIKELIAVCQRAQKKASVSRKLMIQSGLTSTFICGEET
jgi:hypothetical protein